jgi:predicted permease
MHGLVQDARYGLRTLVKSPAFTVVAVLTLALGIGANTAIFTVFDAMMLRMLPVQQPEKLLIVAQMNQRGYDSYSYPVFRGLSDRQQSLSGMFASAGQHQIYQAALAGEGGTQPLHPLNVSVVSGEYFGVLGVQAAAGRVFTREDDRTPGGHPVAVISHGFWERQFGRSRQAIGAQLQLRETMFTIIGVTPRGFFGEAVGESPDVWAPMMMQPQLSPQNFLADTAGSFRASDIRWLKAFGRLKPGVAPRQAEAEMTVIVQQVWSEILAGKPSGREKAADFRIELQPGARGWLGWQRVFSKTLWVLMGLVSLVLLLACCNIANLLLSRATSRQREIAVRLAMGCGRARLMRQLLTESVLLALVGGAMGLYFAWFGSELLVKLISDPSEPFLLELNLDPRVLGFTLAVSLLTGILFGLLPALRARRLSLDAALRPARGAGQGRKEQRATRALVAGQVALSLFLLIMAGLLVRSVQNLRGFDPGFDRHNVLLIDVQENWMAKASPEIYRPLEESLRQIPGVRSASFSMIPLMQEGALSERVTAPGFQNQQGGHVNTRINYVSPSYFETVGMRLLLGRGLGWQDGQEAAPVAVINEKLAGELFAGENPLGRRISRGEHFDAERAFEVVGMVGDAKYHNLREEDRGMIYFPLTQGGPTFLSVELRTEGDPLAAGQAAREALGEHKVLVREIKTLEEQTDRTLSQERMLASLGGFFGLLALTLASVGLYGVLSTAVARRTNEIGLRLALGARRGDVLGLWLREAGILVVAGIALGLPAALGATRWIESYLFGLTPADPLTMAAAVVILTGVAALAAYVPARRAANLDPMEALRYE